MADVPLYLGCRDLIGPELHGTGFAPVAVADDEIGRAVPVVVDDIDVIPRAVDDPHAAAFKFKGRV